jgi:hypothetical protein
MALSKWVPESNQTILRRVGKTGEECAELSKVCSRITIQGIDGVDPVTGESNRDALAKAAAANCCPECDDGDGDCAFPYYGVAPHTHAPGPVIGSTRMLGVEHWPENFKPDAEADNTCGTYTHCLACGRPGTPKQA